MKNKASSFLKQIMSLLSSIAKAKSLAIKNKTSTFRARILMLSLMKNKKFLDVGSISNKINNLLSHRKNEESEEEDDEEDNNDKAIVLYNAKSNNRPASSSTQYLEENMDIDDIARNSYCYFDEDDDGKYPDLRHSLFNEEFDDPGGSIIDIVKNSKEDGADFSLEAEIDHVADLFIMRFHKQMRLQKLDSFKRYKEMLERSA